MIIVHFVTVNQNCLFLHQLIIQNLKRHFVVCLQITVCLYASKMSSAISIEDLILENQNILMELICY